MRSYSRTSGSTALESDTWASGSASRTASPTRCSCSGCRKREQQADRDGLDLRLPQRRRRPRPASPRRAAPARRRAPSARARRSAGRGAPARAGGGARGRRGAGRAWRPISRTSRKPSVVTSAVRAPRRSRRAFVATVIPWANAAISPRSAASTTAMTPSDWSSGVDGTFAVTTRPSTSAARSVNVPPTSTPRAAPVTRASRGRPRRGRRAGSRSGSSA